MGTTTIRKNICARLIDDFDMPKNIAIETAENRLGNAGTQLWRHLVNTHGSPQYSALGVPPPRRIAD